MKTFDLQPSLNGNLLKLRPLLVSDFEELYKVASDPLIWEQHPEGNRYKREVFESFFDAAVASKGALVVLDANSGQIIGSSRYSNFEPQYSRIEIGYTFLGRAYWGQGHNLEMKKLMLNHAFRFVDEVQFYIGESNFRSRKAVEKLGAQLLERLERKTKEGTKYFAVVYHLKELTSRNLLMVH